MTVRGFPATTAPSSSNDLVKEVTVTDSFAYRYTSSSESSRMKVYRKE